MTINVLEVIPVPSGEYEVYYQLLNWFINLFGLWAVGLLPVKAAIKLVNRF